MSTLRCRRYSGALRTGREPLLTALRDAYAPWADGLGEDERDELYGYTLVIHSSVNAYLRGWREDRWMSDKDGRAILRKRIGLLDRALVDARTPFGLVVHRGLKGERFADPFALVGSVLDDPGYQSASLDVAVARKFCRTYHEWDYKHKDAPAVLLDIELPAGSPAALTVLVDRHQEEHALNERELLLPRGSRLQVLGCRQRGAGIPRLACRFVGVSA